jgi:hypothetical protein
MRKAAGAIMVGFGIFVVVGALFIILRWGSGGPATVWILLPFAVLIVAAGISVLRRKGYWWALLAAIGMIVVGASNAGWVFQDPIFRRLGTASQVLAAARSWAMWGVPGLLALIFLVKRKQEFQR